MHHVTCRRTVSCAWKGMDPAVVKDVKEWLDDGGVPAAHQVIQGALAALTFLATKLPLEAMPCIAETAKAFAQVGEEAQVAAAACARG